MLLLLYGGALLADFIAPFDMTWTDKHKSFHPPTPIRVAYLDRGELIVRPFTLELQLVNPMRKSYAPVPRHTVRAISVETEPRRRELRVVATEESAAERRAAVVVGVRSHYALDSDHPALERLSAALQELENAERRDLVTTVDLGTRRVGEREVPLQVILAKGNKNFVSLLAPGIPYRFLGLFTARRHLLGSPSGGVFLLGADQFGRDVLSRLIHGSRVSLSVGLIGVTVSFVFGLLAGGVAGYFGGQTDNGLMRLTEVLLAFSGTLSAVYAARDLSRQPHVGAGVSADRAHPRLRRLGQAGAGDPRSGTEHQDRGVHPQRPLAGVGAVQDRPAATCCPTPSPT